MKHQYFIAIPAYNEANNIIACLESVSLASITAYRVGFTLKGVLICLNACTDDTAVLVENYKSKHPELKIKILQSEKGMNRAIGMIIDDITDKAAYIVKIDA